jgi:hypothetical protein
LDPNYLVLNGVVLNSHYSYRPDIMRLPTFVLISLFASVCWSFMPAKVGYAYTPGNTRTHAKQTEDEISTFLLNHFKIGPVDVTSSIKKARDAIIEANKFVDDSAGTEKDVGEAHFDDELFIQGQTRLMNLRAAMITALKTINAASARSLLGRQLHTLQDFYAHSNWVEMGNTAISDVIGVPGQTGYPPTAPGLRTCNDLCQTPNPAYVASYTCANGCKKGDQTVIELARSLFCFETSSACKLPDCSSNLLGTNGSVTSGYYLTQAGNGRKPPGKCTHGGLSDAGANGTEGINKDSEWPVYAPHGLVSNWHQTAANLSQQATQRYFEQFVNDPQLGGPALTEPQLRLLFGLGAAPLVFVIDTTGSMGDVIAAVQETTKNIVTALIGTIDEPSSYTLMAYNDPAGSDIVTTSDADSFLSTLDSLYASGGGDCPEPALEALLVTLNNIEKGSNVFLFTDARDKDPENFDAVDELAQENLVHLNFFLFPSDCSDGSSYNQLAEDTLGSFIALTDRSGGQDMTTMALRLIDPDLVNIYTDFPLPPSNLARRDTGSNVLVVVDSTMKSVTFRAAGTASLTIKRPDGSSVASGDAGVSYFSNGAITFITITSPAPGTWTASRSDLTSGTALSVFASSKLTFNYFSFVEIRGIHPGWFPINDTLVPGTTYTVNADIEGTFDLDHFEFRSSKTGEILQSFVMERLNDSVGASPEHVWFTNLTVPCGTFYTYIYGKDPSGAPFQRLWPQVFNTTASCGNDTISTNTTSTSSSLASPTTSSSSAGQGVSMTKTVV